MAIVSADHQVTSRLVLDGSPEGLVAAMQKSVTTIQQGTADITGHFSGMAGRIGGSVNSLIGIIGTLGGIVAGGAAFKAIVSQTATWDLESAKLSKTLGGTTEQASILKVELGHLGVDQELVTAAAMRMAKTLSSGSDAFKQLGVDVAGMQKSGKSNLDIMMATIKAIGEYSTGLDRNQAAMTIFGRSWKELQPLMKLSAEEFARAEVRARELHLIVGPEGVEKAKKYKVSLNDLELVKTSLAHTAGSELLGALVEVGATMQGPATKAAHVFAEAIHEVHLGIRDVIKDHGDFAKSVDHYASMQGINYLTLLVAAKAAMAGNYSMLPTILKVGYQSGSMSRDNDPAGDIDPQLQRALYDKGNLSGGHNKHFTSSGGGASAAVKDHFTVDAPGFMNWRRTQADEKEELAWLAERNKELDAAQAELARILHEMELDEIENGLKKSDGYLNAVGKLSDSQQGAFDQSAMLSDWAAKKQASDQAAAQSGREFYAMLGTSGDSELQQTLMRIEQEKEARISSWVMMTDSFEVEAARRAQVEAYYAFKTAEVTRAAERQKLDWTASGFASMSSLADSFYSLSGKRSRAAFEAGKVMKIGETVFTTASAAMKAYDAMSGIPYVGPALGAAAAAAAIAAGMVQIQNIESATPDGGGRLNSGGGGGGDYGGGYSGGSPSDRMVTQPIGQQTSAAPTLNLVINNPIGEKKWFEDNLPGILKDFASRNVNTGVQYA